MVSEKVASYGGNWEASRMARLGGRFAGLLLVTVDTEKAEDLKRDLLALKKDGLQVMVEPSETAPSGEHRAARLELIGHDHPGIISEVSRVLAAHGVNVEDLSTDCDNAAMAGDVVFKMNALLHIPAHADPDKLHTDLEAIGNELMVDIQLVKN